MKYALTICTGLLLYTGCQSPDVDVERAAERTVVSATAVSTPEEQTDIATAPSRAAQVTDAVAVSDVASKVVVASAAVEAPTNVGPANKPAPPKTPAPPANSGPDRSSAAPASPINVAPPAPASAESVNIQSATADAEATTVSDPPSHAPFSALLKSYVSPAGQVDYAGLKGQSAQLDAYLATLRDNPPVKSWTQNERLAYWINAYNAATLDLIVDNYPLSSIQDLDNGKPWDVKRIKLGDATYSLNDIENEIIRKRFDEPRIHFAVNCAATSCPPLRNEAFVAARLDAQLEEQTRAFLTNDRYTKLAGNELQLSKIFDWYAADFPDVLGFVGQYRTVPTGTSVSYKEYDWSLNAR